MWWLCVSDRHPGRGQLWPGETHANQRRTPPNARPWGTKPAVLTERQASVWNIMLRLPLFCFYFTAITFFGLWIKPGCAIKCAGENRVYFMCCHDAEPFVFCETAFPLFMLRCQRYALTSVSHYLAKTCRPMPTNPWRWGSFSVICVSQVLDMFLDTLLSLLFFFSSSVCVFNPSSPFST